MVDEAKRSEADEAAAGAGDAQQTGSRLDYWRHFLTPKWIALVVGAVLLVPALAIVYFQAAGQPSQASASKEISLGTFRFQADPGELGGVAKAEFALHIALLDPVDAEARQRLRDHRFRVQQDIEELLRKAHSGDFDDPDLADLKRTLQEQVNETLGLRAIADVIITNLDLQRASPSQAAEAISKTADSVPWREKPAS